MKKKKKFLTKKARMNRLLNEKIAQFKQDIVNDEETLRMYLESLKHIKVDIERVEQRIQQTQEVIDKLSK